MRPSTDIASELDEGLKRLFDAGLELALQAQANAMTAEPDEQARLSLTFHRLSRGVRQTAALRMRLAREAERAGREQTAEVIQLDQRRLEKRKAHVKAAVECLIWTEAESPEAADRLEDDLSDLLDIETQDADTFEQEPLELQIARLAHCIGLDPKTVIPPTPVIPRSGGTPDPGDPSGVASPEPRLGSPASPCGRAEDDDGDDGYWRSSA
ncbi:hypothetical protein [Phenylobacterium sp.]|uniref:hypothetical protein n=1 Tax=Phenylobacterium sp. TaxID=1871053 RepID=UPI002DF1EF5E|nr:hypothetical protein [Phenylobacterium sp.]